MAVIMKRITLISVICTFFFFLLYQSLSMKLWFSLSITCGTVAFHFGIRLLVGFLYDLIMRNRGKYWKRWYQLKEWEPAVYRNLQVRRWKHKLPTYEADLFNPQLHSWEEIAGAMCQSERIHETNILVSFFPVFASIWVGSFSVFLVTSIAGAGYDLLFVILQRYNRDRVLKTIKRKRFSSVSSHLECQEEEKINYDYEGK